MCLIRLLESPIRATPVSSGSTRELASARGLKPGHGRSDSGTSHPLIYSGGSSVTSPAVNALPTGNICPSGSGTGNYGHGSIMRGGASPKSGGVSGAVDVVVLVQSVSSERINEALNLYDKAIAISPGNAALHCNRAAALIGLKRLGEAVRECEEAIRLDPSYVRAHQRLGSLLLRAYGFVCLDVSGHWFFDLFTMFVPLFIGLCWTIFDSLVMVTKPDQPELLKLQAVEKHISKCAGARRLGDWTSTLKEAEAATVPGAVASPQLFACRAEAYLKLHQLEDAELCLSKVGKHEPSALTSYWICCQYIEIEEVKPQYERADHEYLQFSTAIEQLAGISLNSGKNLDDCNQSSYQQNYTKALLRRAASNAKLEDGPEAVEITRFCGELPYDNGVDVEESPAIATAENVRSRCYLDLQEWQPHEGDNLPKSRGVGVLG
ncbi:hypothetical protein HAX54_046984 [Datura stramonium]|uniref:Uncharacterized protein n=1 Tax=Datura stramonium TaxID=4076 RepID=A0ABS8RQ79_DATST|nr:hypothetical protein [Datura stramonium]